MQVAVVTAGSTGDHRPYLALTRRLAAAGHDATLLVADHLVAELGATGVTTRGYGPSSHEAMQEVMAQMVHEPNMLRHPGLIAEFTCKNRFGDQEFWGIQLRRRQVSRAMIGHRKITAPWLAHALELTTDDAALQARARTLGAQVRAVDGLGRAVAAIGALA